MPCPSVGPKLFLSCPNRFVQVEIILDRSKLKKNSPEKSNLHLTKMNWAQTKRFGQDQNELDP